MDCHLHLQDEAYRGHVQQIIRRAQKVGVEAMFCNTTNPADWASVIELAQMFSVVIPFIGIHPWWTETCIPGWQDKLEELIGSYPCGIGEIGLDFAKTISKIRQEEIFRIQIELAKKYHRPFSIHCVRAWGRLIEILREYAPYEIPFMLHGYNGSVEMAKEITAAGGSIGFNAMALAYGRIDITKQLLADIPQDRHLVETDSPFGLNEHLCIEGINPQNPNEPVNLPQIINALTVNAETDRTEYTSILYKNAAYFIDTIKK